MLLRSKERSSFEQPTKIKDLFLVNRVLRLFFEKLIFHMEVIPRSLLKFRGLDGRIYVQSEDMCVVKEKKNVWRILL